MQIVRFSICGKSIAFPVTQVREVVSTSHISAVFRAPPFVRGLMNVRGEAVPVLDLSLLFNFHQPHYHHELVAIAESPPFSAGFLGNRPVDIIDVPPDAEAAPVEGSPFMAALHRVLLLDGKTVLVLSAERLFNLAEMVALREETDILGF